MLRIGDLLHGYCRGCFGRDSYDNKRVEAIGADWIVVREEDGSPNFYHGNPEDLEEYKNKEEQSES